ncbi:MAG: hypothetical protein EZS28_013361, partial [Streblomastix strix]
IKALCDRFILYQKVWDYFEKEAINSPVEEIALASLPQASVFMNIMNKRIIDDESDELKYEDKDNNNQKMQEFNNIEHREQLIADRVKKILFIHFDHKNPTVVNHAISTFNTIQFVQFGSSIHKKDDCRTMTEFILTLLSHKNINVVNAVLYKLQNEIEYLKLEEECRKDLLKRIIDFSDDTYIVEQIVRQSIKIPGFKLLDEFIDTIINSLPSNSIIYKKQSNNTEQEERMIQMVDIVIPLLEEEEYSVREEINLLTKRVNPNNLLQNLESLASKNRLNQQDVKYLEQQLENRWGNQYINQLSKEIIFQSDSNGRDKGCGVTDVERQLLGSQNNMIRRMGYDLLVSNVSQITENGIKKQEIKEDELMYKKIFMDPKQEKKLLEQRKEQRKGRRYNRFWGKERRQLLNQCRQDKSNIVKEIAMRNELVFDEELEKEQEISSNEQQQQVEQQIPDKFSWRQLGLLPSDQQMTFIGKFLQRKISKIDNPKAGKIDESNVEKIIKKILKISRYQLTTIIEYENELELKVWEILEDIRRDQKQKNRNQQKKEKVKDNNKEQIGNGNDLFNKLHVSNLNISTTSEQLEHLFETVGEVINAEIVTIEGLSQRHGFVTMHDKQTAEEAIRVMNNEELDGNCIEVGFAPEQ